MSSKHVRHVASKSSTEGSARIVGSGKGAHVPIASESDRSKREADYAWAAGFVDGEGSIGIYASHHTYSLTLYVGQKYRKPLDKLATLFGGTPYFNKSKTKNGSGLWDWKISSTKARDALVAMLPFLVVKRNQALLAIEFQSTVQVDMNRSTLSDEDRRTKKWFKDQIAAMKRSEPE